ncbi:MAG TPA: flagellar motor protein MotB [Granulicella sp.]
MSRKKHPEHVNHERWLVSYADFITLLFAFFVVLFASGQSDHKKQEQMASAMQTAFNPAAFFELHTKKPTVTEDMGAHAAPTIAPALDQQPPSIIARQLEEKLGKLLADKSKASGLPPGSLIVRTTNEGIVVSLQEAGFFASGSAEVRPSSLPVLAAVAAALPKTALRVEGHTDDMPIHTQQFATNWELSSARAASIARYLLDHNVANPTQLSIAGYAEYHPAASNDTEEGRARNRRVDIILLSTASPPPPAPSR